MRLNLLHLDDALRRQPRFCATASALGAREVDLSDVGPQVRLWGKSSDLADLRNRLSGALQGLDGNEPIVTWMGSGDFHHVSALLLSLLAEARKVPLTVVQFDNHPDWVANEGGIHCGSWVKHVLDEGIAQRVVSIGMTSSDLSWPEFKRAGLEHVTAGRLVVFPAEASSSFVFRDYGSGIGHHQTGHKLAWQGVAPIFNEEAAARVLPAIETEAIYITIDKDVLCVSEADTNWDQGQMRLADLLNWLRTLARRHKVVGLDVIGDRSKTRFGGSLMPQFLKRCEILIDQPWRRRRGALGEEVNEHTNLAILEAVRAMLC